MKLRDKAREIAHEHYPRCLGNTEIPIPLPSHNWGCDDCWDAVLAGMRAALERVPRDGRAYYEIPKLLAELEEK